MMIFLLGIYSMKIYKLQENRKRRYIAYLIFQFWPKLRENYFGKLL